MSCARAFAFADHPRRERAALTRGDLREPREEIRIEDGIAADEAVLRSRDPDFFEAARDGPESAQRANGGIPIRRGRAEDDGLEEK